MKRLITPENKDTKLEFEKMTPLELCCDHNQFLCVRWLVEFARADVINTRALLIASERDAKECVSYLLSNDADPNYRHPTLGFSALHVAVYKHPNMVHSLLKAKANPHTDSNGLTPLEIALRNAAMHKIEEDPFLYVLDELSVKYLISAGARLSDIRDRELIPDNIRIYYAETNFKKQNCRNATLAFWNIMRRNGCPKDLTQHVCRNYLMPTWRNKVWKSKISGLERTKLIYAHKIREYLQKIGFILFLIIILKNSFI